MLWFVIAVAAEGTFFSNVSPLRTTEGLLFDAHDGNTVQLPNGTFVRFAMGYTNCTEDGRGTNGCGQRWTNTVGVWSSPTLASGTWRLVQSFVPAASGWPNCTYYRVHVAQRQAAAGQWVMWLNGQAEYGSACSACSAYKSKCFLAGVAPALDAPFAYANVVEDLRYETTGVGDFSLFTDDVVDAAAHVKQTYVIYKRAGSAPAGMAHRMTVQLLRSDLLGAVPYVNGSTPGALPGGSSAGIFGAPFVEAPELFKRRGVYYALFGQCCAFCWQGSGVGVYTATESPLGPWTTARNIGCNASVGAQCGCALDEPSVYSGAAQCAAARAVSHATSVTFAQQNSVIEVHSTGAPETTYVWTGDRWNSACTSTVQRQGLPATDVELACNKAWDLQYWAPLEWDDSISPPLPKQLRFRANFTLPSRS